MYNKDKKQKFESKVKDNFSKLGYGYVTAYDVKWDIEVPKDFHDDMFEKMKSDMEDEYYENQQWEMEDYQEQLDNGDICDETEYVNENDGYGLLYQQPFNEYFTKDIALELEENIHKAYAEKMKLPSYVVLEFENTDMDTVKNMSPEFFKQKIKDTYNVDIASYKRLALSTDHQIFSYNVEKNVQKMLDGKEFKKYLSIFASFKNYNSYNMALILAQKPDATLVKGAGAWKALGRNINAGEHALYIETATPPRKIDDKDKLEEYLEKNTYLNPVEKDDLRKEFDQKGYATLQYRNWKSTPVFDISQTNGKDLEVTKQLDKDFDDYEKVKDALVGIAKDKVGVDVVFGDARTVEHFSYHCDRGNLVIDNDLPEQETIKVLSEGLADVLLHTKDYQLSGIRNNDKISSHKRVLECCSVAYSICDKLGIETEYAFQDMMKSCMEKGMSANFGNSKDFNDTMNRVHICFKTIDDVLEEKVFCRESLEEEKECDDLELEER